ncbi:MAG: AraC family transcriptional regulator [Clostridiales bacterium]|nr:AraC family transcriptional regulator [Clostridiales bacterium]
MNVHEPGVLPVSQIFFHTTSEADSSLFLYPLCIGLYECDSNYIVNRINYDSFLLIYVQNGSLYLTQNDVSCTLRAGSFAIIDCYHPHIYGSHEDCKFLWVHFDGALARSYYDRILSFQKSNLIVAADGTHAYRYLSKLYSSLSSHRPVDPAQLSKYLINILTEFMYAPSSSTPEYISELEEARIYINEHLYEPLSLEEIAAQAHLSVYHFTRSFKNKFGYTPHEYLIKVRLNAACFYLVSSTAPVKEIAFKCGFTTNSGFCTCFRKNIGCTPMEYRQAHLSA